MSSAHQRLSLIERLRDNDRTNAMREIMLRAPVSKSRAEVERREPERLYPKGTVPALANSLMVVALLNSRAPETLTLTEISRALGITKSHCHSILRTLAYFDWVAFDDRRKTYALQSSALSDVSSLLSSPALESIRSILTSLVDEIDVPCVLSEPLPDWSFVVIDTFRSRQYVQVFYPVGHRFPSDAAAHMRVMLAWGDPERAARQLEAWRPTRYTQHTKTDVDAVRAEVEATRARGYALSLSEFSEGMTAIAAPLFNRNGDIAYVASFSYLTADSIFDQDRIAFSLRRAIDRIHHATLANPPAAFTSVSIPRPV